MHSVVFLVFGLAACSRASVQTIDASPNTVNSAAVLDTGDVAYAAIDASVALRADCSEPKNLTQLVMVSEAARFVGETLQGTATRRYHEVAGGRGLIFDDQDDDGAATVEDVATRKKIFATDGCAAGGHWTYSLSTNGRMRGDPTGDIIAHDDIDKGTSKTLSNATLDSPDLPNANRNPFDVAFCGEGALFVTSGEKDPAVYRGKDGARSAAAPSLKGGALSSSKWKIYFTNARSKINGI